MRIPRQFFVHGAIALALMAMAAGSLRAQTGTLSGQVLDGSTLAPLSGTQVSILARNIGALARADGRFLIPGVPAGTHEVEFRIIGYALQTQEVTVVAGQSVTVNVEMQSQAIALDELVVTGTGVVTERRRLGQTVASISGAALEVSPISNVSEMLRGRISGMFGQPHGEVGAANRIVLRGGVSLTQRNDPLIYIDGVRIDNRIRRFSSPLDQLNPNDIERIEVIKGAAAATLYGTEASSGVIQIFTKRGSVGDPVFSFMVEQGLNYLEPGRLRGNSGYNPVTKSVVFSDPFEENRRTGHLQDYSLSVNGGGAQVQYFASARMQREEDTQPSDQLTNVSLRTGVNIQPLEKLQTRLDVMLVRSDIDRLGGGPGGTGKGNLPVITTLANPGTTDAVRVYGETWGTVAGYFQQIGEIGTDQLTVSGSAIYAWLPNVSSELTVGFNQVDIEEIGTIRQGTDAGDPDGLRGVYNEERTATTVDFKTSWQQDFGENLTSTFVVGGQSFWEDRWIREAAVRNFSSPALGTLRGGSTVTKLDEWFEEVINAGVYVQEQIGLWDKVFVTGGVRADGNSAFGQDFGFEVYPKAGVSWVVSDHDFWDFAGFEQFRVRAAIGAAGLQPGSFDALRTWQPNALINNLPAVSPLNLGNADLKPERSIERELGAELGLLGGRVGVEFVYFNQETKDGLLALPSPHSLGFGEPQLTNVAALKSSGIEASLNVTWIQRPNLTWRTTTQIGTLSQEITDIGGIQRFRIGGNRRQNYIAVGYMPGATLASVADPGNPYRVGVPIEQLSTLDEINPNFLKNAAGGDSLVFQGNPVPTTTGSFSSSLDLPGGFRVNAVFDGAAGFMMLCATCITRTAIKNEAWLAEWERELDDPSTSTARRQEIADEYGTTGNHRRFSDFMSKADYIRFAELGVTYQVPENITGGLGASTMQVTLASRRLALWTKYKPSFGRSGFTDPGSSRLVPESAGLTMNMDDWALPPPQRFVIRVQATF